MRRILFLLLPCSVSSFIVGGCIGPKSVLERYLTEPEKTELRRIVHAKFDGSNAHEVLVTVNAFVHDRIRPEKWKEILPELKEYQSKKLECSIYAQLLPKEMYKSLLNSVWRASESGASKFEVKRLVEDYLDRILQAGLLSTNSVVDPETRNLLTTTPSSKPLGSWDGYRHSASYRSVGQEIVPSPHGTGSLRVANTNQPSPRFPTLVASPKSAIQSGDLSQSAPLFPIARPSVGQEIVPSPHGTGSLRVANTNQPSPRFPTLVASPKSAIQSGDSSQSAPLFPIARPLSHFLHRRG